MNLTIHRGTKEIGGSCVEIQTGSTRIVVDLGMPLVEADKSEFDFKKYKNLSVSELITSGILPDIPGIYDKYSRKVDSIIISHPHLDHFGFLNYAQPEIPVFIGKAAFELVEISNQFLPDKTIIKNPVFYEKLTPFRIGDFEITPFWNDHSAFDAYSFLIESNGKRIFYSGDFRSHGRKAKAFEWLLNHPPDKIDYLLLEGSTIGRINQEILTESDIEQRLTDLFKQSKGIFLIYASGQNIDRLVSIIRACLISKRVLVLDPYCAHILKTASRFAKIPFPSHRNKNIKVMFTKYICDKLRRDGNEKLMFELKECRISKAEIANSPDKFVLIVRPSMKIDLEKLKKIDGGTLVYSLWEGYKTKAYTKNFLDYLEGRDLQIIDLHTSGHADTPTLKALADALKPSYIIPIHTFHGSEYAGLFSPHRVLELNDKEILEV